MLKVPIPCGGQAATRCKVLHLSRFVPMKVKRRGVEMRIIIKEAMSRAGRPGAAQGNRTRQMMVRRSGLRPRPIAGRDRATRRAPQALRHAADKAGVRFAYSRRGSRRGRGAECY